MIMRQILSVSTCHQKVSLINIIFILDDRLDLV